MNHDRAHCMDFSPDCPESCFRAELTKEALEKYWTIVDWSHFEGTEECKKEVIQIVEDAPTIIEAEGSNI